MFELDKQMLEKHIASLKNKNNEKGCLIVFKGFTRDFLNQLQIQPLFANTTFIHLEELHQAKAMLLSELVIKLPSIRGTVIWCTHEEYLTIPSGVLSLYVDVQILKNNIYHNTFPCLYEIQDIVTLYDLYFVEENETEDEEFQHPSLHVFNDYYGFLRKINNKFWITYADESNDMNFYDCDVVAISQVSQSVYDEAYLELTEEEDDFLSFIDELIVGKMKGQEINISYSGDLDSFVNRYKERISILNRLFKDTIKIEIVTKSMEEKLLFDESNYIEILKRYWGYKSFRKLKMYQNVNDDNNKKYTIEVSQSQIIDDIVKQSELAMQEKYYKDIFVTSPTGAGKSVMFQVPAIYLAEKYNLLTIVISPLIGLMVDQVEGLKSRNVEISATINSEITPVQKMDIIDKIAEGKISILYISPETLLSRSDIKQLIGERRVGMFVIDEAHIVTTWGKAFRSDYWYLGGYLQKLRKEMKFPIATFTATAIYGGIEDMYAETRDSLNLINPISYFGYVKRDDIEMKLKQKNDYNKDRFTEYLHDKFKILLVRIEQYVQQGIKTLVYFPTVTLINNFITFAQNYGSRELNETISYYFGTLDKDKKNENYLRYRNNESLIMLATKAFGMGIDIPDIKNVYHFAPTGNVCDYIQEIGRAARDLDVGYAYFDFLPKDFVHVNRLHGISTIKKYQLVQVIDKILKIVEQNKEKGNIRNILVSSDEFRYIFEKKVGVDQGDDIDNKLKTALLIIEKDFKAKMNYSPLIARPRSLFASEYFMVQKDHEKELIKNYGRYLKIVRKKPLNEANIFGNIYLCDMKALWENNFKLLSFPQFKYKFYSKDKVLKLPFLDHLQSVLRIELELKTQNESSFKTELKRNIKRMSNIFGNYSRDNKYFSIDDISIHLRKETGMNKYFCNDLATILVYSADNYDRMQKRNSNFYNRFLNFDESRNKYQIVSSGFSGFFEWLILESERLFNSTNTMKITEILFESFLPKQNRDYIEKIFILLGMIEAMGLLLFRVNGGDNPEIFIRINSLLQLDRIIKNPTRYENYILNNVSKRHKTSVAMLTYLFENEVSTEQFWNSIEDYFLGELPEEVSAKIGTILT